MVLATTQAERQRQAAVDLALKMKLEIGLIRDLRGFFNDVRSVFKPVFLATGSQPNLGEFRTDLTGLLRRHYRRVTREFGTRFRKLVDKHFELGLLVIKQEEDERTADEIAAGVAAAALLNGQTDAAINDFINRRSEEQADIILNTTQREFDAAIGAGIAGAALTGVLLSQEEIADQVVADVRIRQTRRSEVIAMTEVNAVAERAKQIEAATVVQAGLVVGGVALATNMEKRWDAVLDERTRLSHALADGQIKRVGEPFIVQSEFLLHPSDTSLGATPGNVINCLHPDTVVDFVSPNCFTRSFYKGLMITIKLANGNNITITPNHPILTRRGWIFASKINKTDSVISRNILYGTKTGFDIQNIQSTIQQVYNTLRITSRQMRVSRGFVNFHGESRQKDIDVIFEKSLLREGFKSLFNDPLKKFGFTAPDLHAGKLLTECLFSIPFGSSFFFPSSDIGLLSQILFIFKTGLRHSKMHRFRAGSGNNARIFQSQVNTRTSNPVFSCQGFDGQSRLEINNDIGNLFVESQVSVVDSHNYSGYVYNIDDDKGFYLANGIITHNCRCSSQFIIAGL